MNQQPKVNQVKQRGSSQQINFFGSVSGSVDKLGANNGQQMNFFGTLNGTVGKLGDKDGPWIQVNRPIKGTIYYGDKAYNVNLKHLGAVSVTVADDPRNAVHNFRGK